MEQWDNILAVLLLATERLFCKDHCEIDVGAHPGIFQALLGFVLEMCLLWINNKSNTNKELQSNIWSKMINIIMKKKKLDYVANQGYVKKKHKLWMIFIC